MSTPAQVDANRSNAQQSTGPRTEPGKTDSSHNARQHGLCSTSAVAPGEDPAVYQAFALQIVKELNPANMNQRVQAERIAFLAWKLQRLPAVEATFLEGTRVRFKQAALRNGKIRIEFPAADLIAADLDTMMKLQVYEMRLSRALETARKELRQLQDEAAPPTEQQQTQTPPRTPTASPSVMPVVQPKPQPDQQLQENWVRSAEPMPGDAPPSPQPPTEVVT